MPVVQGAGQIGVPGLQAKNKRGRMQTNMGATKGQGVVGGSGPYKFGQMLRNPWANYLQPNVTEPMQQGWADFKQGLGGQPYAPEAAGIPQANIVGTGETMVPQASQAVQAIGGAAPTAAAVPAVTGAEILGTGTAAEAAAAAQAAQGAGAAGGAAAVGPW